MAALMDLVAGEPAAILLAISVDDWAGLDDPARFEGHLALGGGLDPTWLDLFAESVRSVLGSDEPVDFIDARRELVGPGEAGERTVERVDPAWISAVARIPDDRIDAITGSWIDRVEEDLGEIPREEKPWIRELAASLVTFARRADRAPAVIFAWSL